MYVTENQDTDRDKWTFVLNICSNLQDKKTSPIKLVMYNFVSTKTGYELCEQGNKNLFLTKSNKFCFFRQRKNAFEIETVAKKSGRIWCWSSFFF